MRSPRSKADDPLSANSRRRTADPQCAKSGRSDARTMISQADVYGALAVDILGLAEPSQNVMSADPGDTLAWRLPATTDLPRTDPGFFVSGKGAAWRSTFWWSSRLPAQSDDGPRRRGAGRATIRIEARTHASRACPFGHRLIASRDGSGPRLSASAASVASAWADPVPPRLAGFARRHAPGVEPTLLAKTFVRWL